MNYELSTEVIKVLDELAAKFGVAIDWASENVMPYLMDLYERFITYKIAMNCIPIVLFVIFATTFIVIMVKFFKYKDLAFKTNEDNFFIDAYYDGSYDITGQGIALMICSGALMIILGLLNCFAIADLLKLIFIPEVYMIEYLSAYM